MSKGRYDETFAGEDDISYTISLEHIQNELLEDIQFLIYLKRKIEIITELSHDMCLPTMWHFDKCILRQAFAASF